MREGWDPDLPYKFGRREGLGNGVGYPGVFQGNPHPYPWKPAPAATGAGFDGYGSRVYYKTVTFCHVTAKFKCFE